MVAVTALAGCAGVEYREDMCSDGEYPVLSVGGTGSACVPDAEEPPSGFTRYPEGKVPQQVDDKWDVYWDTHTLDEDGTVVDAPEPG
ncbi:SCO0607 family lipoprotein [Streptomyces sp. NPDC060030]|uniref:SCO0607 family lipoprotein n=1 Tax=Streptomyces sp. NPDC060030 TaxID=3347042 RepID=UPI00369EE94E